MFKLITNDKEYKINANLFVYDECHKIYLVRDDQESLEAEGYGYKCFDLGDLQRVWEDSCPLRFIEFWDVINIKRPLIPQCETNVQIYNDDYGDIIIELDEDYTENIDYLLEQGVLTYYGEKR